MSEVELRDKLVSAAGGGLCGACSYAKLTESSRGSLFLRCSHPELPKYPNMPVLRCAKFAGAAS